MFGSIALVFSACMAVVVARSACGSRPGTWHRGARGRRVRGSVDAAQSRAHRDVRAPRDDGAPTLSDVSYTVSGIVSRRRPRFGCCRTFAQRHQRAAALAAANIVAIGRGAARTRTPPARQPPAAACWRRYRAIWSDVAWSLVGTTTWNVQGQALMFLVAAIVGPRRLCAACRRHGAVHAVAAGDLGFHQCLPPGFRRRACARALLGGCNVTIYSVVRADHARLRGRGRARSGSAGRCSRRISSPASSTMPRCR